MLTVQPESQITKGSRKPQRRMNSPGFRMSGGRLGPMGRSLRYCMQSWSVSYRGLQSGAMDVTVDACVTP